MENTAAVSGWVAILTACGPILIALIGIIPTIISNRKKTQESLETMQKQTQASIASMQKQVTEDIEATKKEVGDLQVGFNQHVAEEEEHRAKQARYRIFRFYDEVCDEKLHSESHWEDILDDVDFYEKYCESHPEFKNNRGKIAMEYLKEAYKKDKATGRFLTHKVD